MHILNVLPITMRIIFTILFFPLSFNFSHSQTIQYQYDVAGNRVKRIYEGGALPFIIAGFSVVKAESSAL